MAGVEAQRASAVQKIASSENGWKERCIERRFMKALTLGLIAATLGLKALQWIRKGRGLVGSLATIDFVACCWRRFRLSIRLQRGGGLRRHSAGWRGEGRGFVGLGSGDRGSDLHGERRDDRFVR